MLDRAFNTDKNVSNAVLSTLRYYALFHYPLKAEEIYGNLQIKSSLACLLVALEDMEEDGAIHVYDGYYSIDKNVRELVLRRKKANLLAETKKMQAMRVGRFIARFPFVRFVGISGSISKGYADAESYFDFFIITDKNRLWISRTMLHLFKKITFLAGQQHKFCMNYFIDTHNLEIDEKNQFTAIELASLIPVCGYDVYEELKRKNQWINNYLPNGYVGFSTDKYAIRDDKSIMKKVVEFFSDHFFPEKINKALMAFTDRKWRKKWTRKNYPMDEYDIAFKTTIHVSKNHPANHQKHILSAISKFQD